MSDKAKQFGSGFRARRKAAGVTVQQIAVHMVSRAGNRGVADSYIWAVENGKHTSLKASTKRRLNEALDRAIQDMRGAGVDGGLFYMPPDNGVDYDALFLSLTLAVASAAVGAIVTYLMVKGF